MKARLSLILVAAAAGLAAGESVPDPHRVASPAAIDALSAVDFLPETALLTDVIDGDLALLVEIAESDVDPGVRIRAYRSLGMFEDVVTRTALKSTLERYRGARDGTDILYLIAAVEALGVIGGPAEVSSLVPLLDASSRDLRATTALALGATGAPSACAPLRARQSQEPTGQVRLAIDAAIVAVCP